MLDADKSLLFLKGLKAEIDAYFGDRDVLGPAAVFNSAKLEIDPAEAARKKDTIFVHRGRLKFINSGEGSYEPYMIIDNKNQFMIHHISAKNPNTSPEESRYDVQL